MLDADATNSALFRAKFLIRILLPAALILLSFSVSWFSVRAAIADLLYRADTPESVGRAAKLEPGNAAYHALLAEHEEGNGQDPMPELLCAIELSPLDSLNLMRAAVREESQRNYRPAEQFLKRAAAVDNKLVPRMALMNYYFRQGDEKNFWVWFNRSLQMSQPEDTRGIFRMAWEQSPNPEAIFTHVPDSKNMLGRYLSFLIDTQRLELAAPVALRFAALADPADVRLPLEYCTRALAVDSASTVQVWNLLSRRKLIPFPPLDSKNGDFVGNPDFLASAKPLGFDWIFPSVDGVFVSPSEEQHGVSIHLAGSEPEDCVVLQQPVALLSGKTYQLNYEYSSDSDQPVRGLRWELVNPGGDTAVSPDLTAGSAWKPGQLTFTAHGNYGELRLRYQRPAGTVRAEGTIVIRKLTDQLVK